MNYVKPTHETCWPAIDESLSELEWRLRYARPDEIGVTPLTAAERVAAASVLSAYRELVNASEPWRRVVIRALRKQATAPEETPRA